MAADRVGPGGLACTAATISHKDVYDSSDLARGAEVGAAWPSIRPLIAAWPCLSSAVRSQIIALARTQQER